jgi:nitroreductase
MENKMNDTLQTILDLRTVHGDFSSQKVSQNDLDLILESAIRAGNASARQSYSIIVLDDREQMQSLFGYKGSQALVFCVDYNRITATARHLGQEFDEDNIIGFVTGTIDTILAAQTAVIAAKSLGIDSLITNGLHRNSFETVYRELELPETSCFPLITVILGYANKEPAYQKGRLNMEDVVHYGTYHVPTPVQLEKIIAEYDDPSRHIGLIENWEDLGFDHYLDWFYTKWCSKPTAEKVPTGKVLEFQQRLIKSGFWWPTNSGE